MYAVTFSFILLFAVISVTWAKRVLQPLFRPAVSSYVSDILVYPQLMSKHCLVKRDIESYHPKSWMQTEDQPCMNALLHLVLVLMKNALHVKDTLYIIRRRNVIERMIVWKLGGLCELCHFNYTKQFQSFALKHWNKLDIIMWPVEGFVIY